jgi:hypothetical protein
MESIDSKLQTRHELGGIWIKIQSRRDEKCFSESNSRIVSAANLLAIAGQDLVGDVAEVIEEEAGVPDREDGRRT